jgi:hypothetical protein
VQGGFSTIQADIVYGIAPGGIDNTPNTKDGDPAGAPEPNILKFDPAFDPATPEGQQLVKDQLADLAAYVTPTGALLLHSPSVAQSCCVVKTNFYGAPDPKGSCYFIPYLSLSRSQNAQSTSSHADKLRL